MRGHSTCKAKFPSLWKFRAIFTFNSTVLGCPVYQCRFQFYQTLRPTIWVRAVHQAPQKATQYTRRQQQTHKHDGDDTFSRTTLVTIRDVDMLLDGWLATLVSLGCDLCDKKFEALLPRKRLGGLEDGTKVPIVRIRSRTKDFWTLRGCRRNKKPYQGREGLHRKYTW